MNTTSDLDQEELLILEALENGKLKRSKNADAEMKMAKIAASQHKKTSLINQTLKAVRYQVKMGLHQELTEIDIESIVDESRK